MGYGGKRPGAGRPKGSGHKPHILDYMTDADIKTYFEFVVASYMGDMRLTTWIGDQISGKAMQAVEHSGPAGAPIPILNVLSNHSDKEGSDTNKEN